MADSSSKGVAVTAELRQYLLDHSVSGSSAREALVAATREAMGDWAIMQIAEEQGPFLTWLARLVGARRAVEVGTFTGLSAMCIAEGLADGGRLTCFDVNDDYVSVGRPFWAQAGPMTTSILSASPAAETLAEFTTDEPLDLAFLDADKGGYLTYYELLVPMLRPGGVVVFDNSLYFGEVVKESMDPDVIAIQAVNDHVAADPRVDVVLINVGDGLLMARKR